MAEKHGENGSRAQSGAAPSRGRSEREKVGGATSDERRDWRKRKRTHRPTAKRLRSPCRLPLPTVYQFRNDSNRGDPAAQANRAPPAGANACGRDPPGAAILLRARRRIPGGGFDRWISPRGHARYSTGVSELHEASDFPKAPTFCPFFLRNFLYPLKIDTKPTPARPGFQNSIPGPT